MIPAEAVEAAMRAFDPSWDMVPTEWRDYFLRRTRAALEAAAPHVLAGAFEEAADELVMSADNPHSKWLRARATKLRAAI